MRSLAASLLFAILVAAPVHAYEGGTLRWKGAVDGEEVLRVHGGDVERRNGSDSGDRVAASSPLPGDRAFVYARLVRGRALVSVDEQPDRDNDWTATVIVSAERYRQDVEIELVWLAERPGGGAGSGWGGGGWSGGGGGGGWGSGGGHDGGHGWGSGQRADSLRWRGTVDGADYIDVKGSSVSVRHLANLPIQDQDYRLPMPLPAQDVELELVKVKGRGEVKLVQQPDARNGFTASVLVDDRDERGSDEYEFELLWKRPRGVREGSGGGPADRLTWTGYVDGSDVLVVRGSEVTVEHKTGKPARGGKASFSAPLPKKDLVVSLDKADGRGRAVIEQQPTVANGGTLRIRIEDEKGGDDFYKLELTWPR